MGYVKNAKDAQILMFLKIDYDIVARKVEDDCTDDYGDEIMANWVNSHLSVIGTENELKEYIEFAKSDKSILDGDNFLPVSEMEKSGSLCEFIDKNRRCQIPWEVEIEHKSEHEVIYGFITAWDPPGHLIRWMSEMFPNLNFEMLYSDWLGGFQGHIRIKGGEILVNSGRESGTPENPYRVVYNEEEKATEGLKIIFLKKPPVTGQ